jgi:hypothetical protein
MSTTHLRATPPAKTPRRLAVNVVAEIRKLDRRITKFTNGIQVAVTK